MNALITGITGQDGSYLAELLLSKGYKVYGIVRRSSQNPFTRINHIKDRICIINGDILDYSSVENAYLISRPDEIYHLAAQSHVGDSFSQPIYTTESICIGTLNMLEAFRRLNMHSRFYQASSSEMFGNNKCKLNELSPFNPVSPYGCAKLYAHKLAQLYRQYGLFVSCGILFNHESPRRGEHFVTRKITKYVAALSKGWKVGKLNLSNIDASRDWGHARDYVRAMWLMLQHKEPDDFVISTGVSISIKRLLDFSFKYIGKNWEDFFESSDQYKRPVDIAYLCGDSRKARKVLGWKPEVSFEKLIKEMIDEDIG